MLLEIKKRGAKNNIVVHVEDGATGKMNYCRKMTPQRKFRPKIH